MLEISFCYFRFTPEVCIVPNVQNVSSGTQRVPSLPNAPANISVCTSSQSNSRQNLDSIVEAIRHLEGDHLFSEDHHQQVRRIIIIKSLFKCRIIFSKKSQKLIAVIFHYEILGCQRRSC